MSSNALEIIVTKGADVAVQLVWSDDQGAPIPCTDPARAEVKDSTGSLLVAFDDGANPATAAFISCSDTSGVIQLTAPKTVTQTWTPGRYVVDVFATVSDAASPFDVSGQYRPAFNGWFVVKTAVTTGAP